MKNNNKIRTGSILLLIFLGLCYGIFIIMPIIRWEKQPEYILINQNENDKTTGFRIRIEPWGNAGKYECVLIEVYYNDELIDFWEPYVKNEGRALSEDFFLIEYYDDYIKINILDCKKQITGIFRSYIGESAQSENDACKEEN